MKIAFIIVWSVVASLSALLLAPAAVANEYQPGNPAVLKVPQSALAKALGWQDIAIEETHSTIWGASPVMADGKVHLFAARWPEANVDPAWRKSSEIAPYASDMLEGPFQFQEVVPKGSSRAGEWDAFAPHNPEIQRTVSHVSQVSLLPGDGLLPSRETLLLPTSSSK